MDIDRWRSRLPVMRAADGELVGWTVGYDTIVDAVNPVGHVVETNVDVVEAADVLERRGLASLSAPYWARAPRPLTSSTDLRRPESDWLWRRVVMTQLDDTKVWLRPGYPEYAERMVEIAVPLPADDVVVAVPPEAAE